MSFVWDNATNGRFTTGTGESLEITTSSGSRVVGEVELIVESSNPLLWAALDAADEDDGDKDDDDEDDDDPDSDETLEVDRSEVHRSRAGAYILLRLK